ncbi:hypothetical protein [Thalassobaculum sp.]|uniref:hypothetical protein n=1 Tax=Thalassobaculum sp. TaxID=2022740 RepID=UPI0032EEA130
MPVEIPRRSLLAAAPAFAVSPILSSLSGACVNVSPGIPIEIIRAEDEAAGRLFSDLARKVDDHERATAAASHIVSPQTEDDQRLWDAYNAAGSERFDAEQALVRYPFVQHRHHQRKMAYVRAQEHIYQEPDDARTLMEAMAASLAIIHGAQSRIT